MRLRLLSLLTMAFLLAPATATADEPQKKLVTKVFEVADLVTPIPDYPGEEIRLSREHEDVPIRPRQEAAVAENADKLMKQVTSMVRPYSWDGMGGAGKLEFFNIGSALVVTNAPEVIQEVSDLLVTLRRLQDVSVATEVRILTVPAGFCERIGFKKDVLLNDREVRMLLEAAQKHTDTSVMQFPKVTTFDGQTASVRVKRQMITGREVPVERGAPVYVPPQPIELGDTLSVRSRISADRRHVNLDASLIRTSLMNGPVAKATIATGLSPIFEGGSPGRLVSFTQCVQVPDIKTRAVAKSVAVPDGGTVVLGGWMEPAAPSQALLGKIPDVNRLYVNAGPALERDVIVLATVRVIANGSEVAPMPREVRTCQLVQAGREVRNADATLATLAIKLRNAAATDAATAVTAHLERKKLRAIVMAEPVSNQVLVTAPPALAKDIERILTALDAPPPQVVVQATIMQVKPGFLADAGLTDDEASKNVLTLTARELNVFNTAIRRGKAARELEVLSHPQVQVVDNQAGVVQVGGKMPIVTGLEITSTENGLTVSQKIEQVDHGVTLRLTPRILPEGDVLLRAEPVVSSVLGESITKPLTLPPEVTGRPEPVTIPVVSRGVSQIQTLSTTARVKDGQTVIIRGLHSPHAKRGEAELLIVLTPHIVKSQSEAGR